jgi:hypothetical protein
MDGVRVSVQKDAADFRNASARKIRHFIPGKCTKALALEKNLLNRAGYGRKHAACIGPDKPNRTHSNGQDHRQHDGVLRDVLSRFPPPQFVHYSHVFILVEQRITQGRLHNRSADSQLDRTGRR